MIKSKLTSKSRTTIPLAVRTALRIAPGDEVVYALEGDRVILTRATRRPTDDPFAAFSEWSSDSDRLGYIGL